ncbi:MAG: hypothetical protein Q4G08_11085 [Capnocytophaga sp.]|nr:hypothetical protein [Capnocytophaga sp.]
MKKTLFMGLLAVGTLTAFAQNQETKNNETNIVLVQGEYKEIEKDKLPEAVVKAFEHSYQGATIDKVFVNDKEEYKIEATDSQSTAFVVFADKDGNWITKAE